MRRRLRRKHPANARGVGGRGGRSVPPTMSQIRHDRAISRADGRADGGADADAPALRHNEMLLLRRAGPGVPRRGGVRLLRAGLPLHARRRERERSIDVPGVQFLLHAVQARRGLPAVLGQIRPELPSTAAFLLVGFFVFIMPCCASSAVSVGHSAARGARRRRPGLAAARRRRTRGEYNAAILRS